MCYSCFIWNFLKNPVGISNMHLLPAFFYHQMNRILDEYNIHMIRLNLIWKKYAIFIFTGCCLLFWMNRNLWINEKKVWTATSRNTLYRYTQYAFTGCLHLLLNNESNSQVFLASLYSLRRECCRFSGANKEKNLFSRWGQRAHQTEL